MPLFGGTFFSLTGLHMTHVTIGLIYLAIIAQAVMRGKFKAEDVEVAGLPEHSDCMYIHDLSVDPSQQGKGIAKTLFGEVARVERSPG